MQRKIAQNIFEMGQSGFCRHNPEWSLPFSSWKEAADAANGYDHSDLLKKVREAALLVRDKKAAYERDSVLFDQVQYAWPVLATLQKIALENKGNLRVVDFGGALGTSYFQTRSFLNNVRQLNWYVVEQPNFVACGQQDFESEELHFINRIEDALGSGEVHCLLASGVLQVLEKPYEWIRQFLDYGFDNILLDRTAFINGNTTLVVHHVPEYIHSITYPHWFFNEREWLAAFMPVYKMMSSFAAAFDTPSTFHQGEALYWKGFHLKKNL